MTSQWGYIDPAEQARQSRQMHGFDQPSYGQQFPVEPGSPAGPEIFGQGGREALYNSAPRYQEERPSLLMAILGGLFANWLYRRFTDPKGE